MPNHTHAKDSELMNGRGAVHKSTDLVQPSWRAADVEVKTVKRSVESFAKKALQTRPLAVVLTTAAVAVGVGAVASWLVAKRAR